METELVNTRFDDNRKRQGLQQQLPSSGGLEESVDDYQGHVSTSDVVTQMTTTTTTTSYDEQVNIPSKSQTEVGDKSRKGSIDTRILQLVSLINFTDEFFTTSTCSGRIILFTNETLKSKSEGTEIKKKIKKKGCEWLFVTHDEMKSEELVDTWKKSCKNMNGGDVYFKVEPAILHVQCRKLSSAKKLVHAATESGFRNSGMVIGGRENRITVAVRSALGLEVPLYASEHSGSLISDEFLKYLVDRANEKIVENWIRLNKFTEEFRNTFIPSIN